MGFIGLSPEDKEQYCSNLAWLLTIATFNPAADCWDYRKAHKHDRQDRQSLSFEQERTKATRSTTCRLEDKPLCSVVRLVLESTSLP